MDIIQKPLKEQNIDKKVFKDFNQQIVNKKPFKLENIKEWFAGQKVHLVAKNYKGLKELPATLTASPGIYVIDVLDRAWLDKGDVAEGMVADLVLGCEKDPKHPMIPEEARHRIIDLFKNGYLLFSDSEGNIGPTAWEKLKISEIWFRLSDKFRNLLISDML